MNTWIMISDRLPDYDTEVIGITTLGDIYKVELYDDCGEAKWCCDGNFDMPIVAWMPLPVLSKAVKYMVLYTFVECGFCIKEKTIFKCPAEQVKSLYSGKHRIFIHYRDGEGLHFVEFDRPKTYIKWCLL